MHIHIRNYELRVAAAQTAETYVLQEESNGEQEEKRKFGEKKTHIWLMEYHSHNH